VLALVAALIVIAAGGLAWLGWFSTALLADTVKVEGVNSTQARAVRQVAAVPLGGPVMRVDTAGATARLERDGRWKDVSVSRSLPHSIVIAVVPRVAVLAVRTPSGRVDLYDRDGLAFQTVSSPPQDLPVVAASAGAVSPEGVRATLEALSALDEELRGSVTAVTLTRADRVTLTLNLKGAARTVIWGRAGDASLKARVLAVLVGQTGQTIDVSVPGSPVTR
jgi:cell division protein FtsQ